jgi:hypothetical protein
VIPRRGTTEDIQWFEADPTYVLHWSNAYEDGDEIVLDGFFQRDPMPKPDDEPNRYLRAFRGIDLHRMQPRLHRWRFDLHTGQTKEEDLSDRVMEFAMINARHAGRPYRYAYNMTGKRGWFLFDGIVKVDLETGAEQQYAFGDGVYGSETPMAPRPDATAEDDGYLVTFTTDMVNDRSECLVFDAADIAAWLPKLNRFAELMKQGVPHEAAFAQAMGDVPTLARGFDGYIGRSLYTYLSFNTDVNVKPEGKHTRILYVVPVKRSTLEVMRNYAEDLEVKGFKRLFSCSGAGEPCGTTPSPGGMRGPPISAASWVLGSVNTCS